MELVSPTLGLIVSFFLPWFELIVGICLLFNVLNLGGLFLSVCLFGAFVFILFSVLYRGLTVNCGCFKQFSD